MAELSTTEKADKVAETTIKANPQLDIAPGRDQLKSALSEKLAQSHDQGKIDLDKFLTQDKTKERSDRGEGRER